MSTGSHGPILPEPTYRCVEMQPPGEAEQSLSERKAALRDRIRALRRAIPPDERVERSAAAAGRLLGVAAVADAPTILVFASFGSEISTSDIVDRLLSAGSRVLLPYVAGTDMLVAELRPGDRLVETEYGPREPPSRVAVEPAQVDAVVVPGLAFDRQGHRLGYGGGYFDRFLALLSPKAPRVGLCFDEQLVEGVPHGPHDQRVDLVVTDRRTVTCEPSRAEE
jgi:5-formyltetrahydrofolate cyclo-ligase